jgi:hypothetical protein
MRGARRGGDLINFPHRGFPYGSFARRRRRFEHGYRRRPASLLRDVRLRWHTNGFTRQSGDFLFRLLGRNPAAGQLIRLA